MNKDRLNELCEILHKAKEIENTFLDYCNNQNCEDCPLRSNPESNKSCRTFLFENPEQVLPIVLPKSFGEEILEVFPDFDFENVCCEDFFKGKTMSNTICDAYDSCEQHYMSKTRKEILEELRKF